MNRGFSVVALAGAMVAACGHTSPPNSPSAPASVTIAPPAASVAVAVPAAPILVELPSSSAVIGSVDLSKLDNPALATVLAAPLRAVADDADVDFSGYGALMQTIGIDVRRPLSFAVAAPFSGQERLIESVRGLAPEGPVSSVPAAKGLFENLRALLGSAGASDAEVALRVLVPVSDAARVKKVVATALGREWHVDGPDAYTGRLASLALAGEGDTLVADVAIGHHAKEAIGALGATVAAGHVPAPALGGELFVAHLRPSALGGLGFLTNLAKVMGALSGGSIDPDQRDRIASEGLWEANAVLQLTRDAKGPFFDDVEMQAAFDDGQPKLVVSLSPRTGLTLPPDALWAASRSAGFGGGSLVADLSLPFARAWPLVGDVPGNLAKAGIVARVKDAGSSGMLPVLPFLVPFTARAMAHEFSKILPYPDAIERFDRLGALLFADDKEAEFGVLPPGTTRGQAECVLAGPRCTDEVRLRVGVVKSIPVPDRGAPILFRLSEIDKRFVVIFGRYPEPLARKAVGRAVGPAVFEVDGAVLEQAKKELGVPDLHVSKVSATIERQGERVVMTLSPQ